VVYQTVGETKRRAADLLTETMALENSYNPGHSIRVRTLSSCLARHAGLETERIELLEYGALLHDIGKIGIIGYLLYKKERLTPQEKQCINLHTIIGEGIIRAVALFGPCLSIIRNHHERYDGSGYPDRLGADQIDPCARIVSVSDAFDAMISPRPYRQPLTVEHALEELTRGRGTQFDPVLVDIFIENELYRNRVANNPDAHDLVAPVAVPAEKPARPSS
jgi:HD-GYP domain-containing protein (c-di-GMP phosphodiesterase class II)